MPDSVNATAGDGSVVLAADEISGLKYPRGKIVHGADGSQVDTSAAAPFPVAAFDTAGVNLEGAKSDAAWDLAATSPSKVSIRKAIALLLGDIKAAVINTAAVSIVKLLSNNARETWSMTCSLWAVSGTTEALINTFQVSVDQGTPATGLSEYTVPAGKRLRITAVSFLISQTTGHTTQGNVFAVVRTSTGATITTSSPPQMQAAQQVSSVLVVPQFVVFPAPDDGFELGAGCKIGMSILSAGYTATTMAPKISATLIGHLYDDTP